VSSADPSRTPLLEARGIGKVFGSFRANDGIDLVIGSHEIHALLGENGAGKSTLVKIFYGLLQPSEGELSWQGRAVRFANPAAARAAGIGMVFQHFSLFENLTVAENVALSLPAGTALKDIAKKVAALSLAYGLPLDPRRAVHTLSVGERQRIEIVRCLMQDPKLIILDEPTSVLTPQEAEQLFVTLNRIAGEGRSVLYISHRLEEVKRLCHTATILRHGRKVATCDPQEETAASLARMMVGADIAEVHARTSQAAGPARLVVKGLTLDPEDIHGTKLRDISLTVRGGEICAIAGVAGNGQAELFEALSGERLANRAGAIAIDGREAGHLGITSRRRLGAAFVPEERNGHAAAPLMTLSQNIVLTGHATRAGLVRFGLVDQREATAAADAVGTAFDVRKGRPDPEAGSLSGGNLQKFVIGREILREPGVLVVSQPTWGVDAGAAATIRQSLIDLSRRGTAVLVISQDLDEIFEIADRIAVIHAGELSDAHPLPEMTLERVGLLMGGAAHAA
jgi:general nucleoside transport system ATP-binding protein